MAYNLITVYPDISVGVLEFDEQHEMILSYIDIITESIAKNYSDIFIQDLLDALKLHMAKHFLAEEEYFIKFNYPGAREHTIIHADFLKRLIAVIDSYKATGVFNETDKKIVFNWLVVHIKGVDRMYTDFFHSKGIY